MTKNKIIPDPQYYPFTIYHNPHPCQMRMWSRSILIYRPTLTNEDYIYAQAAVNYAKYWHLDIVTLDKWTGVPGVVRASAKVAGVKVILCKTLKEAMNSADIRNWK